MVFPDYLGDVAQEMARKSEAIRRDFGRHRQSAGDNREDLVGDLLRGILPKRFGISTGLIFSGTGMFSNQADLIVVDELNNAPLYPDKSNQLWPVEAVYALIEVKTHLNPSDIDDSVRKGRNFKSLTRRFSDDHESQSRKIDDSLFIIWAFESPEAVTVKKNLTEALSTVPVDEQPDFIIVPDRLVVQAGQYRRVARLGQPNSEYRRNLEAQHGQDLSSMLGQHAEVYDLRENSLMAWYVWCDSWLRRAGPRVTNPLSYLPSGKQWGTVV